MKNNLHIFNPTTGNYYTIDLSLCHPSIYLDFDWSVCDDLHRSEHLPILIKETESSGDEQHCRWNFEKSELGDIYYFMSGAAYT